MLQQSREEKHLNIISPALLEQQAKANMPPGAFEFVHGAAGDEWTARQNVLRLRERVLNPHRLAGFSQADTTSTIVGVKIPAPLYVCPMGAQDIVHTDAEVASAKGAELAGIPYVLSSASNRPLEEVAAGTSGAFHMFAIYLNQEASVNQALAKRARDAKFRAIVMTVDSLFGPGDSERYLQMGAPKSPVAGEGNFDPKRGGSGNASATRKDFFPEDIVMLKEASGLPVFVKGILRPEDAQRCMDAGATGVIVSNHGGRTLDGAPAAIDVLSSIVQAVGSDGPVLFDSGVRRGTDVMRALALGATAVGIGRPVLDAMALGGATGVADLLNWFKSDLAAAMLLVGARRCTDLSPAFLAPDGAKSDRVSES